MELHDGRLAIMENVNHFAPSIFAVICCDKSWPEDALIHTSTSAWTIDKLVLQLALQFNKMAGFNKWRKGGF
jgi:hypothetical protein